MNASTRWNPQALFMKKCLAPTYTRTTPSQLPLKVSTAQCWVETKALPVDSTVTLGADGLGQGWVRVQGPGFLVSKMRVSLLLLFLHFPCQGCQHV